MQIIVKLTADCNLACSYCIEGEGRRERLPEELFKKLIDDLPELLAARDETRIDILFHGGEPLLYGRAALAELVAYGREKLPDTEVVYRLQSNGTLIDDKWIDFFLREKIGVGISFDGYPKLHDSRRRTKNGEPTAEKVLGNIEKMRAAGLKVGTLMVLDTAEDINADELFNFIKGHRQTPKIHAVIDSGRAAGRTDAPAVGKSYAELMKSLFERALIDDSGVVIEPLEETMNAVLGLSKMRECSYAGTCGENFMCLYTDGSVGFCGRNSLARNLLYGNLREQSLTELYLSPNAEKIRRRSEFLQNNDCYGCECWEFCHGGCAFEAVNSFGELYAKHPRCETRKEFITYLRTVGVKNLKTTLLRKKKEYRNAMKSKKAALAHLDEIAAKLEGDDKS